MKRLNKIIMELGISKVRLAKYLGVSRQMVYNYLDFESLDDFPKEKKIKLFKLLGIEDDDVVDGIEITPTYALEVEARLNEGVKEASEEKYTTDLKGFNKKEQEILNDIISLLKEKMVENKSKNIMATYKYLYQFMQAIDTMPELKYILAYISKSLGLTNPEEFAFNYDQQFIFESIFFSAFTLYHNGGASRSKIADSHRRFVQEIEHRNEEKLSRTQELNTFKNQALKELGYTEINEINAREVLEKIAEIQSRKIV